MKYEVNGEGARCSFCTFQEHRLKPIADTRNQEASRTQARAKQTDTHERRNIMWRPPGAHIRKLRRKKEELTKASEGIIVDEAGVAGYYRGTIATRNRIRGILRIVRVAIAGAVAAGIISTIRLRVLALMEGQREGDCEGNRHKSTGGNGQP
jgi:hypothetical protein